MTEVYIKDITTPQTALCTIISLEPSLCFWDVTCVRARVCVRALYVTCVRARACVRALYVFEACKIGD